MNKIIPIVCATILLLTGCTPKDDFADYELAEPPTVEGVTAQTEFLEYNGDTEVIHVAVTNNSAEDLFYSNQSFVIQKFVDSEWRTIKSGGHVNMIVMCVPANDTGTISVQLKDHVKLPLLPGRYRVWVGDLDGGFEKSRVVPAEFTVK